MNKVSTTVMQKIFLIIIFGGISILGTYTGFPVKNAIANTRAIGIIVAGLIAGPFVGTGVGLVSGFHRYSLGGLTVNAAIISAVIQGYISGIFYKKMKHKKSILLESLLIGAFLEVVHMAIVVIITRPLEDAITLIKLIGPPMIIINSLGIMLLLAILESVRDEQERTEGRAAEIALEIANKTLPYMKKGLNKKSAQAVAEIIFNMIGNFDVVCLTSRTKILAYIQRGQKTHLSTDNSIFSKHVLKSIEQGQNLSFSSDQFGNTYNISRIIIPLKIEDGAVGTIVLSKNSKNSLTHYEVKLAKGLAQLISTQLEISKVQYQSQLVAQAEIRALQAQINPHFLFNALNTIVYYCLVDSVMAKNLIIHLGDFYRKNIVNVNKMVQLDVEIQHVKSYLVIEMARFEDKLNIVYDIDPECCCLLPPLVLQPIVENAVKHGILPKEVDGSILIKGMKKENSVVLTVEDDGVGMNEERLHSLFKNRRDVKHIGLKNVKSRLENIFGDECRFEVVSHLGIGTKVSISIPCDKGGYANESLDN
jgi:two-component system sensor histidine kinase LytS